MSFPINQYYHQTVSQKDRIAAQSQNDLVYHVNAQGDVSNQEQEEKSDLTDKELEDQLLKPHLQPVGPTPPSPMDFFAANPASKPEMTLSWNIFGAYGGDIPICEKKILEELEKVLVSSEDFKIEKDFIQPLPLPKLATLPQQLFELLTTRKLIESAPNQDLKEAVQSAINDTRNDISENFSKIAIEIRRQIEQETAAGHTDYLPLLNRLATHFEADLDKSGLNKKIDQFEQNLLKAASSGKLQRELDAKLPENKQVREEELWVNRKGYIKETLDIVMDRTNDKAFQIPVVTLFQELNVDQYNDMKNMFPENWTWISFSTTTGMETDNIPFDVESNKFQDGHGFTDTILLSPEWEVLDVKKEWLSATPNVPSPTENGSPIPRMIMGVTARNKLTGENKVFINTHVDHFHEAHLITAQRINRFVNQVTENGAIPFRLGGDFNFYLDQNGAKHYDLISNGKQDFREGKNDEFLGFFAPEEIAQASFGGLPRDASRNEFDEKGNLKPKALDHIFTNQDTKIAYSFRNGGVYDDVEPKHIVSAEDPNYSDLIKKRKIASDHFLNGVVTIE